MDEIAYREYVADSHRADILYRNLRELYGSDMDRHVMLAKARISGVITLDEWILLDRFYP